MKKMRTEREVEQLVALARHFCTLRAAYRCNRGEGRLSAEADAAAQRELAAIDARLELLKSNSELDRQRAAAKNIVTLTRLKRKA